MTDLAPAVPAGVTQVMVVGPTSTTLVAATPPIVTDVAPEKSVPVMVTAVPPAVGPLLGAIPLITGAGTTKVKPLVKVAVWLETVTATVLAPAAPAGVMHEIDVGPSTVTLVALAPPIVTVAPTENPVPEMVTLVPPAVVPELGEIEEMVGAGAT